MSGNLEDYIDKGIHGVKETNIDERKKFLSTIKERVILALTNRQVMKNTIYQPIQRLMKQYPDCQLFLDGEINYAYLSKYIKLANKSNVPFTIVDDLKSSTDIGLVLATKNRAINLPNIYIKAEDF